MPKAARKGDIGSAHGCFPASPAIEGSEDVFLNGIPAVRVGDAYAVHGCSKCPPHGRSAAQGSATVNINGRPAFRVGDAIDCGGAAQTGSPNVNIGDESWTGLPFVAEKPIVSFRLSKYPGSVGRTRKQEPYKLYKNGGLVQQGLTNDEGLIHYEYELPLDASKYEVEVEQQRFAIDIKALAPPETDQGVQQRLAALGYNCFDDTDSSALHVPAGNPDEADVRWVQSDDDVEASGTITEKTTSNQR